MLAVVSRDIVTFFVISRYTAAKMLKKELYCIEVIVESIINVRPSYIFGPLNKMQYK
jgi:ribosomal protein S26